MDYISEKYGLVTKSDPFSENGQLFMAELILIQKMKGIDNADNIAILRKQIEDNMLKVGLYNRNIDLPNRTMSHDNMSGIMSFAFEIKSNIRFEIWDYIMNHFGVYNNTPNGTDITRFLPFNPSNLFIWGLCVESFIYLPFIIVYFPTLLITCSTATTNTTGKILQWVELYPHREHWLCKYLFQYYEYSMKKQYGDKYLESLMKIYFVGNDSDFPIFQALGI